MKAVMMGMGNEVRRKCGRCKRTLPVSDFGRYRDSYQSYCKSCQRAYDAGWYRANRTKRREKVVADRRTYIAWLDSLKEGRPCADCGKSYPPYVMEWDHLPGTEKQITLADTRRCAYRKKRILEEIAKCELVCANCHRERTFGSRKKAA